MEENSELLTPRNQYFDFLRGIAIIMVVGIHTSADHLGFDSWITQANTVLRQILNVAVPLFFAISGYFLAKKELTEKESIYKFWRHQIPKVYCPALIWGLPWLVLAIHKDENIYLQFFLWLCCGLSVLYFVAVIIQMYLLLPVIKRISSHLIVTYALILSFVSVVFITWVRSFKGVDLPLIVYAGAFPLWIMFFVIGGALSRHKRTYNIIVLACFSVMALFLQFWESVYLGDIGGACYGIKISSFIFSIIIILLLLSRKVEDVYNNQSCYLKSITWLGRNSFGIYLTHCLVIFMLSRILKTNFWVIDWVLVICMDAILIILLKRIIPTKYQFILGL